MDKNLDTFTLPSGPKSLCFDKNQFLGENFSVDVFLHNHRNVASLETLRDDLGVYLKVLRSAMIDLINKDYADFVSLSTNLIGLDKEINSTRAPLAQLKDEVSRVRDRLADAMKELSGRLEQRQSLRERKRSLHYLNQTQKSLQKLCGILLVDSIRKENISQELVERAASEFIRLQFTFSKCVEFTTAEQKKQYEEIEEFLMSTLDYMFLENLQNGKMDKLQRCLQIFSMLDKILYVEQILRKKIIGPTMHEIISESALQKNPAGLRGIFSNILIFIEQRLQELISITKSNKSLRRYNFLLNSFWPEVECRLEIHMSSIFAPGNPELFYSRYNDSLEFLKRFVEYFGSKRMVEDFYNHPQYKSFQQKWNLPIYFQIRFQEIAGSFESILSESINADSFTAESLDTKDFLLKITKSCWTSLTYSWADGIFIAALTHRFWKLSLQVISRYCTWIDIITKQMHPSLTSQNQGTTDNLIIQVDKMKFLTFLHTDIKKLIDNLPTFLEIIKTRLHPLKRIEVFEKSLLDSELLLKSKLPQIQKTLVQQISAESIIHLKQINDIPRLFRKTNRDIPTKPCGYVNSLIKPSLDFYNNYLQFIGETNIINWLEAIFSNITSQYYTAIDDVLTSIQKTEDSLRRLKQIRDRPSQTNLEKLGISDDDKIRMQLKVDIDFYCQTLTDLKLNLSNIEKLNELVLLVDKATSKSNVMP